MGRFLCFLGVLGLLAGASFVLPTAASAQGTEPCGQSGSDFTIAEIPFYQISPTLQAYQCSITPFGVTPRAFDLSEFTGTFSDNVNFTAGQGGIFVNLFSDNNEVGQPEQSLQHVQEVSLACPPGFQPEPGGAVGDLAGSCDGARVELFDAAGNDLHVTLTVYSDIAVPEPSTGLLLGAALPALLGLRRRSVRVSS